MTDFEREDMELAALMGDKFIDETQEQPHAAVTAPVGEEKKTPIKSVPVKEKPVESQWMPKKPSPDFMERLKKTTKEVGLYGLISTVVFWWQQTGRLEETTAWYALLVCVGMVFFSVGKNCRGGK